MQQHHLEKGRKISEDDTSSNKGCSRHISPPDIVPAFQLTLGVSRGHSLGQKYQDGWTSRIPTHPPGIPVALAYPQLLDHLPQAELILTGSTGFKIQVMGNRAGKNPNTGIDQFLFSPPLPSISYPAVWKRKVSVEYIFTINKSVQVALFHPKCLHNLG